MTAEERQKLRQKMETELIKLDGDIQNLKEQTKPIAPDDAIGRLSRMEAINSKSIQEANLRTARQKLGKLKVALTKIDDEDFGLCRDCDEPIPMGRLLAMPEKDICVDCAGKHPSR